MEVIHKPALQRPQSECYHGKHNLGKHTQLLRTQYSEYKPFLSELSYKERSRRDVKTSYMGARPMHRTTLTLDVLKPKLDYHTLYKEYYSGSKELDGVRRPPSCPSLFRPQWDIGEHNKTYFKTMNHEMFPPKFVIPIGKLRESEVRNKFASTHGLRMMDVTDCGHKPSYRTSYNVEINHPANERGYGVPHIRKRAPQFNVITGVTKNEVPKVNYRRTSGNRILHRDRVKSSMYEIFALG